MDTTITSAPAEAESAGSSVATETPGNQTLRVGSGEPMTGEKEAGQSDAGASQERTEDGQQDNQKRSWSKVDEIRELRAWRREAKTREAQYLQNMNDLREELNSLRQSIPGRSAERNPANFWNDPEASIKAQLQAIKEELRDGIVGEFHQVRETDMATSELNHERGEAVEFIRSQKGYDPADDEDLIEIIEENGLAGLAPMQAARAAWSILQQGRGVGNRSTLKNQAAGVVGQPPGAGLGKKIWSQAEYDRVLTDLERAPMKLTPDLEAELMSAVREGRVR